jgi:hypothetical protein
MRVLLDEGALIREGSATGDELTRMVNDLQLKEFIYEQPAVPAKYLIRTKITTPIYLTHPPSGF